MRALLVCLLLVGCASPHPPTYTLQQCFPTPQCDNPMFDGDDNEALYRYTIKLKHSLALCSVYVDTLNACITLKENQRKESK